jgi:hypothetical protein
VRVKVGAGEVCRREYFSERLRADDGPDIVLEKLPPSVVFSWLVALLHRSVVGWIQLQQLGQGVPPT